MSGVDRLIRLARADKKISRALRELCIAQEHEDVARTRVAYARLDELVPARTDSLIYSRVDATIASRALKPKGS